MLAPSERIRETAFAFTVNPSVLPLLGAIAAVLAGVLLWRFLFGVPEGIWRYVVLGVLSEGAFSAWRYSMKPRHVVLTTERLLVLRPSFWTERPTAIERSVAAAEIVSSEVSRSVGWGARVQITTEGPPFRFTAGGWWRKDLERVATALGAKEA